MKDAPQTTDFALPGPAVAPSRPVAAGTGIRLASLPGVLAVVLLVISLLGLGIAWRAQQRVQGLEQELVRRQQDSSGQAAEARMLAKAADDSARDAAAKVALLEARLAEVSVQRGQLEDVIQQLSRTRDDNVAADIEGAIRVASQQMLITGSAEPMVATLHQADDRLARINQPRLEGVRRAISRDLDKMRAVGTVNIPTLSIKLDEAARLVDELPLLSTPDSRSPSSVPSVLPALPASGPHAGQRGTAPISAPEWLHGWIEGWDNFWGAIWAEARGLVRVTRIDHPEAMLIAPDNAFFVRENLKLRLLNARLAVLSRQFDTAQTDLAAVQSTLERYFDRSSRKVGIAIDTVRQVASQARQIAIPRPDDTLSALAALAAVR